MSKPIFKSILLIIILGVPACWYLFLQSFGENQFELTPLRSVESTCLTADVSIILTQPVTGIPEGNQFARLRNLVDPRISIVVDTMNCIPDTSDEKLYLIDEKYLRGAYFLTIDDVDRLIVEQDLLLTLLDGSSD